LIDLATSPSRMTRYAAASRARAAQLTIDTMVERTLEAYQSLSESPAAAPAGEVQRAARIAPPPPSSFPIASLGKATQN
jgi:hypothetical protein